MYQLAAWLEKEAKKKRKMEHEKNNDRIWNQTGGHQDVSIGKGA